MGLPKALKAQLRLEPPPTEGKTTFCLNLTGLVALNLKIIISWRSVCYVIVTVCKIQVQIAETHIELGKCHRFSKDTTSNICHPKMAQMWKFSSRFKSHYCTYDPWGEGKNIDSTWKERISLQRNRNHKRTG